MTTQKDVQDLLRLLTTGRNKIPMLAAMGRVKELRNVELHSISAIASSDLPTLKKAIPDEKAAKALLAACKTSIKSPTTTITTGKRPSDSTTADFSPTSNKKIKSAFSLPSEPLTPAELEASLTLPAPSITDNEETIEKTVLITNRAPLVLVFAVVLLKYTMPEQPLSGRLSLAQAVCSANSRSKAVSLGLERPSGESVGMGQPRVRIMGREVPVLKRGGYVWREDGEDGEREKEREGLESVGGSSLEQQGQQQSSATTLKAEEDEESGESTKPIQGWTVSASVTSKKSTFIARSITITSQSEAKAKLRTLMEANPNLRDASHNITAYRVQGPYGLIEDSNDDGESGGGRHILGVLKDSNVINVLLVVSRWYGGVMLGPDRWRIMSQVSRDVLSQRLRVVGSVGQEALWGLDLEGSSNINHTTSASSSLVGSGMPIHRPESARAYILKAFASKEEEDDGVPGTDAAATGTKKKKHKKTAAEIVKEKEVNLGLLIGALDLLFKSWADVLGKEELDRRAWGWYVSVRPEVEAGVGGWGGKGEVRLGDILRLRRVEGGG